MRAHNEVGFNKSHMDVIAKHKKDNSNVYISYPADTVVGTPTVSAIA